jgi:hypothetical protein
MFSNNLVLASASPSPSVHFRPSRSSPSVHTQVPHLQGRCDSEFQQDGRGSSPDLGSSVTGPKTHQQLRTGEFAHFDLRH